MGKSRGKKYKVKSSNPIGLQSIKELEMAECELSDNIGISNVEEIVEKVCFTVSIRDLVENTAITTPFHKKQLDRMFSM